MTDSFQILKGLAEMPGIYLSGGVTVTLLIDGSLPLT
jgi:hypothetical protein